MPAGKDQPLGEQRWIELRIPGADTRVVLYTPPGQEDRVGTPSNVVFASDDVRATFRELAGRGVKFEDGRFTWSAGFWAQPLWRWAAMMDVGVRAAFVASQHAARLMVPCRRGLIVNVSQWAAQKYHGNVIYGVSKAATDKLTADMAVELRDHDVAVISLYPGLVRTEAVLAAGVFDLNNSESPEFIGRADGRSPRPLTLTDV